MTVYTYARVSAQDQHIDRQIDAFHNYGVIDKNIYADKKAAKTLTEKITKNLSEN